MNWSRVFNATMLIGVIGAMGFTTHDWWTGTPVSFSIWLPAMMFLLRVGVDCFRDYQRGVWA